jgi:hypothetical protein
VALGIVLALALGLRLWGIKQGLPYIYNVDEYGHFVPEAVKMFSHGLNPHYFINPPAFTYLLHVVIAVCFGGAGGVSREFARHPAEVFLVARVTVAVIGTISVWLLYLLGARLFSRAVGLLAATLMAVAFLPVFYSHLALNDVPTLAPLTLSLLGSAGVLRRGRALDYLMAGAGGGLASATKYTAGLVIVALLAASVARYLELAPDARRRALLLALMALLAALGAFVIANPYALLDFHSFRSELARQSGYAEMSHASWVGAPAEGGPVYYLWSFTWGLGWVPSLAALGGALSIWRRDRRLGWLLVPGMVLYLLFMSLQGRYFGRWLLPILPIACLLAANFALEMIRSAAQHVPRLRVALLIVTYIGLSAQSVLYSVHSGLVLARADTRNITRKWMLANVPAGSRVVIEPVLPNVWLTDHTAHGQPAGAHWRKYPALRLVLNPSTGRPEPAGRTVLLENYELTLGPALVGYYEQHGYCWVVSGFTQSGRASVDPAALPNAIAYYRALGEQSQVVYHLSPYGHGEGSVSFGFDWTFDYYPLAYERPGPEMTVYHLRGGACAGSEASSAPASPSAYRLKRS